MSRNTGKRKLDAEEQRVANCEEQDNFMTEDLRMEMESMWEIPQIFHFLYLTKDVLNIPQFSMYEMERMLLIPRISKQLTSIMTVLLSSPMTKAKLQTLPPMPYIFWTNVLAYKVQGWFKIYEAKHQDAFKVTDMIGIEPQFWSVFPDAPLLNGKNFEELTFRQRVWLLKTVCDTVMHTRKTVQEAVMKQKRRNKSETVLGIDRYGVRYIYFPQFLKSDLRIYKICLDNKILSTVKPVKPKLETHPKSRRSDVSTSAKSKVKCRRRRSRWRNGLTPRSKRKSVKRDERYGNDFKCNSDSATGSLLNEETSLSGTSICSNNNNNNNINVNVNNARRLRSFSKCSEMSSDFHKVSSENVKSSGYDTNTSFNSINGRRSSQRMFKGFSNCSRDACNKNMLNRILSNIKSEKIAEERRNNSNKTDTSQNKLDIEVMGGEYLSTNNLEKDNSVRRTINKLRNVSKTDDEKLHEIINANNDLASEDELQIAITSKSDDEKLSETKIQEDRNRESSNCKDFSLRELRSFLHKESIEDHSSSDMDDTKYDNEKSAEKKKKMKDFNLFLQELGKSSFQLVADSVDSLRKLILSISEKDSNDPNKDINNETESVPPCEERLVHRLKLLLSSIQKNVELESCLKESVKIARAKLQKEWNNLKIGSVEDQETSGEGLGSNWWVLGSQGCPLSTSDDPFQALSQSTVSRTGDRDIAENAHETNCEHSKQNDQNGGQDDKEGAEDEGHSKEGKQENRRVLRTRGISSYTEHFYSDDDIEEEKLEEWADIEAVYAAPSTQTDTSSPYISPTTKQPNDEENEEDSDQDWILPSSRKRKSKRPSANRRLKSFQQKLQSIKVEGLQDAAESSVISPSSPTNEKDKEKLQEKEIYQPTASTNQNISTSNSVAGYDNFVENDRILSSGTICHIGNVVSMHSELDIKDEGPIYDPVPYQPDNNYNSSFHSNYVMIKTEPNPMSYYVMQPGHDTQNTLMQHETMVSSVAPSVSQGYYVGNGGQNYIIHNPHPGFVVPPQSFQPQGPQMITPQQVINYPGYVPYVPMISTANPQPGYMTADQQIMPQEMQQNPVSPPHYNPVPITRPAQVRQPALRHNNIHSNGAVIRSSLPIMESLPRISNVRSVKNMRKRNVQAKIQNSKTPNTSSENSQERTTSLIVLSDSDDEIEMIITEKINPAAEAEKAKSTHRRNNSETGSQQASTSSSSAGSKKNTIPPEILLRMSQGAISITPIKPTQPTQPTQSNNTQLVVVVNETGSHYALALPNGSKLILTPEQIAQIRASNGGKLIL